MCVEGSDHPRRVAECALNGHGCHSTLSCPEEWDSAGAVPTSVAGPLLGGLHPEQSGTSPGREVMETALSGGSPGFRVGPIVR